MNRWIPPSAMVLLLASCATVGGAETISNSDEFNRTTSCVAGELPLEIRSHLLGKPTPMTGDVLDMGDVDALSNELDPGIASLLQLSMRTAWTTATSQSKPWTKEFLQALKVEYAAEIASQAPKRMHIEFCGPSASVGNAVLAAISSYFSRSITFDGVPPKWLAGTGGEGTAVVMLAVGLRLEKIEFDPGVLVTMNTPDTH